MRSAGEALGLNVQLFFQQTLAWKTSGGARSGDSTGHSASYDLFALADLEELAGVPGLGLLLHAKGQYDRSVNAAVGALSDPFDDADFDEPIYVSELWLQQELWRGRVSLRAGFLEQQTIFDRNAYANSEDRQFLATFLDNSPLVPLSNALGAAVVAIPWPGIELALGVADADNRPREAGFDTAFDGVSSLSVLAEIAFAAQLPQADGPLPGRYRVGFVWDGRRLPRFGELDAGSGQTRTERGHPAVYLSFEQLAWREAGEGEQGLGVFARGGWADPRASRVGWFWSFGVEYVGLLPGRDADLVGLGAYQAIVSRRLRRVSPLDLDRESGVELYYRIALLPWLDVTPDLQIVVDPGASATARDAVVLALRLRATF